MRATLQDIKTSRIPELVGVCATDTARLAAYVNDAQQRLIFAGRESGWWQGWVRCQFTVTVTSPYITLPREFARIINMAIGQVPIYIHNDFYEVLPGGPGIIPEPTCQDWCGAIAGYERGTYPTSRDVDTTNQYLRVYTTDTRDVGSQILIVGLDQNGNEILSQNGLNTVNGFYLTFADPFTTSLFIVSKISGIVKPVTFGDILLMQVDATTGAEVLLSRYKASETNPAYRRYYIAPIPNNCCPSPTGNFAIKAIAKQEFIPAIRDTDYLIIQCIPALTEMIMALRYYGQDVTASHQLGEAHEKRAIKILKQELDHYMGTQSPAVSVDFMQGASLRRIGISTNI